MTSGFTDNLKQDVISALRRRYNGTLARDSDPEEARVITAPCVATKSAKCVEVCPVEAIIDVGDQFVINPDECLGCGACDRVCPVYAIFEESKVPSRWATYVDKNRAKSAEARSRQREAQEQVAVRECDSAEIRADDPEAVGDRFADIVKPRGGVGVPFLMAIDEVGRLVGRGIIAQGRVIRGSVVVGDEVEVVGAKSPERRRITGIVRFNREGREIHDSGADRVCPNEQVGLLLPGLTIRQVERNQVLAQVGSIRATKGFRARVYLLPQGRTSPIFNGYSPQFFIRVADVTGKLILRDSRKSAVPGDVFECNVVLSGQMALEIGLRFAIREGGRTVGFGAIIELS